MIYLVPHSHYDAAWVFTKEDYLFINIESIIKKADNADAVILRLFETKGKRTKGVIRLFKEPASVKRVNLLEEEEGSIGHRGNEISLSVRPFEIISLKIGF